MGYSKVAPVILGCSLMILGGCATTQVANKPIEETYYKALTQEKAVDEEKILRATEKTKKDKELERFAEKQLFFDHEDAYAKGYREGVRENIQQFGREFIGNNFPYYYWQAPLVQKVYIPARIVGGSFQPGHWEYVIIMPGYWREEFGYPIGNKKEGDLK